MPRKTFMKKTTSEELTAQINPKNIDLAKKFLKERDTICSDTTIKGYKSDLNIFFTWNLTENENKFFVDIEKIELSFFFGYGANELQWGSSRFARMRACLSSFSNFIEKYYDKIYPGFRNVILKAIESMPKNPAREKTVLSEKQVDNLFNYLKNDLKKPQEACLLALMVGSGARVSELLRFKTDIIDESNTAFDDIFLETIEPIKTKGRTKKGKVIKKYIIKDVFMPYYKNWLIEREKIMKEKGQSHNFIFITRQGTPATVGCVRGWLEKWELFVNLPIYPHCFRHYIVSYLTRLGLSSDFIVEVMGWNSADMYKIYNDVSAKEKKWKGLEKLKTHITKDEQSIQLE